MCPPEAYRCECFTQHLVAQIGESSYLAYLQAVTSGASGTGAPPNPDDAPWGQEVKLATQASYDACPI
jgi:hypothetical protein